MKIQSADKQTNRPLSPNKRHFSMKTILRTVAQTVVLSIFLLIMASPGASQSTEPTLDDQAEDPTARFVWAFELATEHSSDAYRLDLSPAVMSRMNLADADDLMVVDQRGRAVPFARVPSALLTESVRLQTPLLFETSLVSPEQADQPALNLDFEHRGARLQVRAPSTAPRLDSSGTLRFEALLALAEQDEMGQVETDQAETDQRESSQHASNQVETILDAEYRRLQIEFQTDQPLSLECWLRSADDQSPATRRIDLTLAGDSRPRRYLGQGQALADEQAWHLACYGPTAPDDLQLIGPELIRQGQRLHQSQITLTPPVSTFLSSMPNAPEQWQFELPGPYLAAAVQMRSAQTGLFSRIDLRSRSQPDQAWTSRGAFEFSTLEFSTPDADQNSNLGLIERQGLRHRQWQFDAEPPLGQAPTVEFQAKLETLVFLAQGEAPWRLLVGSRKPGSNRMPTATLSNLNQRLGPIWTWQEIEPSEPKRINPDSALQPPSEPISWANYALWIVLITGALGVVVMAFRLLKMPAE